MTTTPALTIANPSWVADIADGGRVYTSDEDKMRLVVTLARENVIREAGGPFAAAVFEIDTGRLVAAGVNSVVRLRSSTLHAEIMALMMAQHGREAFSLGVAGLPAHGLIVSCEPCAMCLGAILWSGVRRVVHAADGVDARRLGFEEGPVFPDTYRYLEDRGIAFTRGVLAEDARAVLRLYRERGGPIYNG